MKQHGNREVLRRSATDHWLDLEGIFQDLLDAGRSDADRRPARIVERGEVCPVITALDGD